MAQVTAILQVATTATVVPASIPATVTPTPTPTALTGTPTIAAWVSEIDLLNSRMKFGYMAYQLYSAAGGASGMATVSGTSAYIDLADVSADFPNVSVGASVSSSLAGGVVTFTISSTVSYTQTSPGIYSVTVA